MSRKADWEKKRKTALPRKTDRKSRLAKKFGAHNYTPWVSNILAGVFCDLAKPGQELRRTEILKLVNEAAYESRDNTQDLET